MSSIKKSQKSKSRVDPIDKLVDEILQKKDLLRDMYKNISWGNFNLELGSEISDIYEAYVFSLVIQAAREEGGRVEYSNILGRSKFRRFIFRTKPGKIFSRAKPYTYAIIKFKDKIPLELHIGVRVAGSSKVLHECDVLVLKQSEANLCRGDCKSSPRSTQVLIALECKFYSSAVHLSVARSFVGMVSDFSNISKQQYYLICNTKSKSAEALISHNPNRYNCQSKIVPNSPSDLDRFKGHLRDRFKSFKARPKESL